MSWDAHCASTLKARVNIETTRRFQAKPEANQWQVLANITLIFHNKLGRDVLNT